MMKAIAIDDEPMALEVIRAHAAKVPFLELKAVFTDAFGALEYLQREPVDLLFLDIKMPDISGIEFYASLSRRPLLIFTTAYSEHAAAGFELDAVDYLLKPFSFARFLKGCNKAYELHGFRGVAEGAGHIFVKTGYEQVKVALDDILYLEAAGNYVSFILKEGKVLARSTFAEASAGLPPGRFVRIHRSYIVAVDKIDRSDRQRVWLGKTELPVGEAYAGAVKTAVGKRDA